MSWALRGVGEIFGGQVVRLLDAGEHRSARILMRKRGAEAATPQAGRMDAEDPSKPPSVPS